MTGHRFLIYSMTKKWLFYCKAVKVDGQVLLVNLHDCTDQKSENQAAGPYTAFGSIKFSNYSHAGSELKDI